MIDLVNWLQQLDPLILVLYGVVLGWLLHSKKRSVEWFFRDHWVAMFCWAVFIIWPLSSYVLFWVNVFLWGNFAICLYTILHMLGTIVAYFWVLRTGRKNSPEK